MTPSPDDELRRRVEGEMDQGQPLASNVIHRAHAVEVALGHARREQEAKDNLMKAADAYDKCSSEYMRRLDAHHKRWIYGDGPCAICTPQPTRTTGETA